jgi:hypothetical protein
MIAAARAPYPNTVPTGSAGAVGSKMRPLDSRHAKKPHHPTSTLMAPAVQNHDHTRITRRPDPLVCHRGVVEPTEKMKANSNIQAATVNANTATTLLVSYEPIVASKTATILWISSISMVRNFDSAL